MPVHNTGQMNTLWQMDPPQIEHRCLEYQYTTLGRQTYFGRWTPREQSRDALNTSTHKLADKPTLADGPPWWIENRYLEYHCTKHGRQTYFGRWTPQVIEQKCLEYWYTQLGRQTYFYQWTHQMPNSNFKLLMTSSSQEWQFHIGTDI